MTRLSILTATLPNPERSYLLQETYQSLFDLPFDDWEWCLQIDKSSNPDKNFPAPSTADDGRIRLEENPEPLGLARTRNRALGRARGDFVLTIDDDDLLLDPSPMLQALQENPKAGWATSSIEDFSVDGAGARTRPLVPEGLQGPHLVPNWWASPWDRFPFIPACSIFKREVLLEIGGWEDLPQGEDIISLVRVDAHAPAWIIHRTLYRYRQHADSFFSDTGAQHWWKYLQEDAPSQYRQTREIVFERAWRLLWGKQGSPFYKEEAIPPRLRAREGEVVLHYALRPSHPCVVGDKHLSPDDLCCLGHSSEVPSWSLALPPTESVSQESRACAICNQPLSKEAF